MKLNELKEELSTPPPKREVKGLLGPAPSSVTVRFPHTNHLQLLPVEGEEEDRQGRYFMGANGHLGAVEEY